MRSKPLSPPWHKLLLTIHVATTVSVLGLDLALLALGIAGLAGSDQQTIYPAARLIASWMVAPLALVSLTTGLLLALLTPWGVLRYWWVAIKLATTVLLTGAVIFVLVPGLGEAADTVTGPAAGELTRGERVPLVVGPAVSGTLLLVAVVLAVFKPGWRLRSRATRATSRLRPQPE
jgi:hypothetical protein